MVQGTIDVSELMGSAVHLHINAMGKDGIIIVPTMDLKGNTTFNMGSTINFTFGGDVVHVFNKSTGANLEYTKQ